MPRGTRRDLHEGSTGGGSDGKLYSCPRPVPTLDGLDAVGDGAQCRVMSTAHLGSCLGAPRSCGACAPSCRGNTVELHYAKRPENCLTSLDY